MGSEMCIRDSPYISRESMKNFLADSMDYAEKTVRNKLDPSRQDGLIMPMLNAGIIEVFGQGWRVIDPTKAAAMGLARAAPKCP